MPAVDPDAADPTAARLIDALLRRRWKLAVAESLTGGMVGRLVTTVPGAGDVFRGGIISYMDEVKRDLLGVDSDLLRERGAVTAECARQMARGALERFGADLAVATTGFAGPTAPEGMPVGLVFVGVATRGHDEAHEFRFDGSREDIRRQSSAEALRLACERALGPS